MKGDKLAISSEKLVEAKTKKGQGILASIERISSIIGKKFTCDKCGQQRTITMSFLDKDWKEGGLCWNCCTPKVLESFIGKECLVRIRKRWESNLRRIRLNPLSIAKYFYENWKVSDPVIMQRLIYFAYLEILEKENIVLFEEKFQAWPGGPVLESVIYPMYENCEDLESFFAKVEEIEYWNNITVLECLKRNAKKYLKLESSQTYRKARNKPWMEASDNENDNNLINEDNLFIFVHENRRKPLSFVQ